MKYPELQEGYWVFKVDDVPGSTMSAQDQMVTLLVDIANSLRRGPTGGAAHVTATRYQTAIMGFVQDHPQICKLGDSLVGDVFPKILRLADIAYRSGVDPT